MATLPDLTTSNNPRETTIRNISLAALIVCPAIIAVPPRKLDIYTVVLFSGTLFAANNVTGHYTGRSITTRMQDRMARMTTPSLPPAALETQKRLKEERLREKLGSVPEVERQDVLVELRRQQEEEDKHAKRGVLKRIWLGGEDEDWKAKRDQREKEALERGEGYGGLIMDQIKEVFGGAKEKVEEIKEEDEKVLAERNSRKKP